jgi:ribosomal protein L11 methyltransferase
MPYRIDISYPNPEALDILIELGALDLEPTGDGMAAIMPDGVSPERVGRELDAAVSVSAAMARDDGSVWILTPRSTRIGSLMITSPEAVPGADVIRLRDTSAFGTGHHPTTALCIEALEEILTGEGVNSVLDVGTGSGILALAALTLGVPQAVGLDIDPDALEVAAENARTNHLDHRLELILGGPNAITGTWPLLVANVLAASLIDMAPLLVRRVQTRGRLILSGIPSSLEPEVRKAYQHFGMRPIGSETRAGWTALVLRASW